ncbi:MAG TPA: hypothetical protein ENH65_03950 [Candidatus Aminicenantes bacterium]|nr:hypothetical protein [Candidatus Aminicenantes bacterium]
MSTVLGMLVRELLEFKISESIAREARIKIEKQIANLIPTKDSGQKTIELEDGWKVTVKRGFNYRTNIDGMRTAFEQIGFPAPIKTEIKHTLDVKGYEWYREMNVEVFSAISSYVTVTPKKIAVSLQEPKSE